jgi:uncharacterized membrane protein YqiK
MLTIVGYSQLILIAVTTDGVPTPYHIATNFSVSMESNIKAAAEQLEAWHAENFLRSKEKADLLAHFEALLTEHVRAVVAKATQQGSYDMEPVLLEELEAFNVWLQVTVAVAE